MGQIIIKVPGDIKKEINDIQEAIKILKELEKSEKQKKALEKLISLAGTLPKDFKIDEDDLYMQED